MHFDLDSTIAALASAPGAGGRGIVRVSGTGTRGAVERRFTPDDPGRWEALTGATWMAGTWAFPAEDLELPMAVAFWPDGRSYTGQPQAELHFPGSPPLLEAALADLAQLGVRGAQPGEFTLRAFLAGKLDLLQAEAVLGVIDAHDHLELQTALGQLAGGLSGQLLVLQNDLLELLADLEAGLDFVEEDIEFVSRDEVAARVAHAKEVLDGLLRQSDERMISQGRPRVVLSGLPNAGKSTLLNRLAGQEAAIVSAVPGTTRDYLVQPVDWRGLSFDLVDTAGWETAARGPMEQAQALRHEQVGQADLLLWCTAADLSPDERRLDDEQFAAATERARRAERLITCADQSQALAADDSLVRVSSVTGAGLDDLTDRLRAHLGASTGHARAWLGSTAARCRESLQLARASLARTEDLIAYHGGDELLALELRDTLQQLGLVTGAVYTDDILDRIFSKFCIGK